MSIEQTAIDIRNTLGLSSENPCDYSTLMQTIEGLTSEFGEDARESLELVSSAAMGNFMVVFATLMSDLFAGAGNALVETFADKLIFENFVSATVAAVTTAITVIPSFEIIFIYLAAVELRSSLLYRIQLSSILSTELEYLAAFIHTLETLFEKDYTNTPLAEIAKSLKHVENAELRVGLELGKLNANKPINTNNIEIAHGEINLAIDDLTGGTFSVFSNELASIHSEYGLQVPNVSTGSSPNAYLVYFSNLQKAIKDKYYGDNYKESQEATVKQLIRKLFKVFPDFIKLLFLKEVVTKSCSTLIEKFPVFLALGQSTRKKISKLFKLPSLIRDSISPETSTTVDSFFTNNETKNFTWKQLMTAGKLSEASLLLFPTHWDFLKTASGIGKNILIPARDKLTMVRREMSDYVGRSKIWHPGVGLVDIEGSKVTWNYELVSARNLLNMIVGDNQTTISIGGTSYSFNPTSSLASFDEAKNALQILENFITTKHSANVEPGDTAFNLAQRYLGPLSFDVAVLIAQPKWFTAGVQSVKIALKSQYQKDIDELLLVNNLLEKIKSIPQFPVLLALVDELLKGFYGSAAGQLIGDKLKKGDLSDLVDTLNNVAAITETFQLVNCLGEKISSNSKLKIQLPDIFEDLLKSGGNLVKLGMWISFKNKILNALKDKFEILSSAQKQVEKLIG